MKAYLTGQPTKPRNRRLQLVICLAVLAALAVAAVITRNDRSDGPHWTAQTYLDNGSGIGWAIKTGSGWDCRQSLGTFTCSGGEGVRSSPGPADTAAQAAWNIGDDVDLSVRYDKDRWRCANVTVNGRFTCQQR